MTEGEIQARDRELTAKIDEHRKKLSADAKLELRTLVGMVAYVERMKLAGREITFAMVEREIDAALAKAETP